jgi:hypothetical protein
MTALLAFLLGSVLGAIAASGMLSVAFIAHPWFFRELAGLAADADDAVSHAEDCACDACRRFR